MKRLSARQRRADKLLEVWLWEMGQDAYDDEYDCTCDGNSLCPMHRVAAYFVDHGTAEQRKWASEFVGWPR